MTTQELMDYIEDRVIDMFGDADITEDDFDEIIQTVKKKNEDRTNSLIRARSGTEAHTTEKKLDAFNTALENSAVRDKIANSDKLNQKFIDAANKVKELKEILGFKAPSEIKNIETVKVTLAKRVVANNSIKSIKTLRGIQQAQDLSGESARIIERRILEVDKEGKKAASSFRNLMKEARTEREVDDILQEAEVFLADRPKDIASLREGASFIKENLRTGGV